ncbi:hypothetical protein [Ectobacillus funiculus]|uniref:Tetratricopeptide repeat protein n=1 Tax=Ectobacillus funiculus TaxID=137993 RepID=A0ABV5WKR6_9BACI
MEEKEKTVIMFPNLSDRLREKGFDSLHNKQFSEALDCFNQLGEYGFEDEESEFAAVVCLIELHDLKEARKRCGALLKRSDRLFFEVLEMYLSVLLQQHDYQAVAEVVHFALADRELSNEQREKLYPLLSFAEKMEGLESEIPKSPEEEEVETALGTRDVAKQLQALYSLRQRGSTPAGPFVARFLEDETNHPYVKSVLLQLLMESGVRDEVSVTKYGRTMSVVPCELPDIKEDTFVTDVLLEAERGTGGQNPTMIQALAEYWYEIMFLVFPFSLLPLDVRVWAAVLEKIGSERFMLSPIDEQIVSRYGISQADMEEAYSQLLKIEQEGLLPL